jgi:predicted GNAT superfamily acetyltransferase
VAAARGPSDAFRFRLLQKPEEFRAVAEVQRIAWGLTDEPPLSPAVLRAVQDNGGLVLGAFADVHLAGFALGFLGWDGSTLYHYSQLTAVRPEYQNHHLGIRLKIYQREEVRRQGLSDIRWVFDPLQSRNALVNLRKLGARVTGYKVHYYGQPGSELDRGSETDRLTVRWETASPEVDRRLAGQLPTASEDADRFAASEAIVETEAGDTGLRVPTVVAEPTRERAHLEIPFDIALIREHEPKALLTWRHAVRDAFRAAFDTGFQVDDFAVVSAEHERRSFYFLSKRPPAPPGVARVG